MEQSTLAVKSETTKEYRRNQYLTKNPKNDEFIISMD